MQNTKMTKSPNQAVNQLNCIVIKYQKGFIYEAEY